MYPTTDPGRVSGLVEAPQRDRLVADAQALVAGCKVKIGLDAATGCARYDARADTFQFDVKVPKNTSVGSHRIDAEVFAPDASGLVNAESVEAIIRR